MGAGQLLGKALAALTSLGSGAEKQDEPRNFLVEHVGEHYHVNAKCAACGQRVRLDMKRIKLRAYGGTWHGVTVGGLRDRLKCSRCRSRRTSLELSLTPRD